MANRNGTTDTKRTLVNVKSEAVVVALANTLAEGKAETPTDKIIEGNTEALFDALA